MAVYGIPGGTLRGEGKTARANCEGRPAREKLRGANCEGRPARATSEERAGMQRGVPLLPFMRFGRNIRLARFCLVLVTRAAVSSS